MYLTVAWAALVASGKVWLGAPPCMLTQPMVTGVPLAAPAGPADVLLEVGDAAGRPAAGGRGRARRPPPPSCRSWPGAELAAAELNSN